jgi:Bacterial Ig domain
MLAQRVSRLWFGSVVAGFVLFGAAGTASAAPPTCTDSARVLYQLPAGLQWTHPRARCTDADGDPISIEITDQPDFGTFDPAGTIPIDQIRTYKANEDAAGKRDSMKWRAVTADGMSDEYQVDVWILPAHSAPVCNDLSLSVQAGTSIAITPECTDADGDSFVLRVTKTPEHGTYDPARGTYTAASRYAGPDSMTFEVKDDWNQVSVPRTVTIMVTQAPGQPTATADKTAPTLALAARSPLPSRKTLRRGIRLTALTSEPGRIVIEAYVGAKTAQKLGIDTRVGSLARDIKAGKTTLKLRLYRKVRGDLADVKRVRLRLVARMVDRAGNLRTKRLRVTLERR